MADLLSPSDDGWIFRPARPSLCVWCWLPMQAGDSHGVITAARDGGATVTCSVNMKVQLPRACAFMSSDPAPQDEG